MSTRLFQASWTLLVAGCLLIALSDNVSSWRAIVGIICLVLALIGAVVGFVVRGGDPKVVQLRDSEKQLLHATLKTHGVADAVAQLRRNHPEASLVQAKRTVDMLQPG